MVSSLRILVTGAGGFLGSALARALAERGAAVSGTHIEPPPELRGVEWLRADLLDGQALEAAVGAASPDVILHLAALSHAGESWKQPAEFKRVNVTGTRNLLRAAAGRRVVLASTAQVYGRVPEERQPIREDTSVEPRNPYAESKAAAERLVLATSGNVVRLFNVVGPGQSPTFALPSFACQLAEASLRDDPVLEVGNLSPRRDFVHLSDAVEGFIAVVEKGEPGGVYNLGSGTAWSMKEALELLMEVSGSRPRLEVDPQRMRPADVELLCAHTGRLRELGWEPRRTLREALVDLWSSVARS